MPFANRSAFLRIPAMSVGMVHGEDVYRALSGAPADVRSLPARYFGALVGVIPYELGGLGIRGLTDIHQALSPHESSTPSPLPHWDTETRQVVVRLLETVQISSNDPEGQRTLNAVRRYLGDLGEVLENRAEVAQVRMEILLGRVQEAIQAEHMIERGLGVSNQELIPPRVARSLLLRQMISGPVEATEVSAELGNLIQDIRSGRTALRVENGALRAVEVSEGERVSRSQSFLLTSHIEDLLAIDNGRSIQTGLLPMSEATMVEARDLLLRQALAEGRSPGQALAYIRDLVHQVQEGGTLHIRGGEVHVVSITSLVESSPMVPVPSHPPEETRPLDPSLRDRPTVPPPSRGGRPSQSPSFTRDSISTGVLAAAGVTAPLMPTVYELGVIAAHVLGLFPVLGGFFRSGPSAADVGSLSSEVPQTQSSAPVRHYRDTIPDGTRRIRPGYVGFIFGGGQIEGRALPLSLDGTPRQMGNVMVRYNSETGQCDIQEHEGRWRPLVLGEQFETSHEGRFILIELNLGQIHDLRARIFTGGAASFDELDSMIHEQLSTHGVDQHVESLRRRGVAVDPIDEGNFGRFFDTNLNEALVSYDAGNARRTQGGIVGGISRLYAFVNPQTGEIYHFCSRPGPPNYRQNERWSVRSNISGGYEWFERRGRVEPLNREGVPPNAVIVPFVYQRMTGRILVGDLSQSGLSETGIQRIHHIQGLVTGSPSSPVMAVMNQNLF